MVSVCTSSACLYSVDVAYIRCVRVSRECYIAQNRGVTTADVGKQTFPETVNDGVDILVFHSWEAATTKSSVANVANRSKEDVS